VRGPLKVIVLINAKRHKNGSESNAVSRNTKYVIDKVGRIRERILKKIHNK
jgi:hypothetical protein